MTHEKQEGALPSSEEPEHYGEPGIASFDGPFPKFLFVLYAFLPLWGIVSLYYFWNGSVGWLDRGHWHELQMAAKTTFPIEHQREVSEGALPRRQESLEDHFQGP